MKDAGLGQPVRRVEDLRLVRGQGRYTDDIATVERAAYLCVVRSPHAAARILSIDVTKARQADGVLAVLTPEDMRQERFRPFPTRVKRLRADGSPNLATDYYPLAIDMVRHVGEAVIAVVAETMHQARDAAELGRVDYMCRAIRSPMSRPRYCPKRRRSGPKRRETSRSTGTVSATATAAGSRDICGRRPCRAGAPRQPARSARRRWSRAAR